MGSVFDTSDGCATGSSDAASLTAALKLLARVRALFVHVGSRVRQPSEVNAQIHMRTSMRAGAVVSEPWLGAAGSGAAAAAHVRISGSRFARFVRSLRQTVKRHRCPLLKRTLC